MRTINDLAFLKILYRRFCRRRVSTHDDIYALSHLHVEVHAVADGSLTVSV